MSRAYDYDVAVVGASIAGCTVATLLGRAGARVALLERRPDAASYKTMCTHFIQPSATPTIERLGLAERIAAAGGIRQRHRGMDTVRVDPSGARRRLPASAVRL